MKSLPLPSFLSHSSRQKLSRLPYCPLGLASAPLFPIIIVVVVIIIIIIIIILIIICLLLSFFLLLHQGHNIGPAHCRRPDAETPLQLCFHTQKLKDRLRRRRAACIIQRCVRGRLLPAVRRRRDAERIKRARRCGDVAEPPSRLPCYGRRACFVSM